MSIEKIQESHAAILDAYLGRLSLQQLRKLFEAHEACWRAQNNEGTQAQINRMNQAKEVAKEAIGSILYSDLRYVEHCIARHVQDTLKSPA